MKQLRNILTGVLLACGLLLPAVSVQADSIPAAQNGKPLSFYHEYIHTIQPTELLPAVMMMVI